MITERAGVFRCGNLLSKSPRMREVFDLIRRISETNCTVLIVGEPGAGKEEAARAIHKASHRRAGPFVAVNCAALNENVRHLHNAVERGCVMARGGRIRVEHLPPDVR